MSTTQQAPGFISAHATMEPGKIDLSLLGREWTLQRPSDLETLWASISDEEFAEDERLPYWVELWPVSLALASWLHDNRERIKGKYCLDAGCGLGFTAIVGAWLGARVVAMDYEPEALTYASKNAVVNAVPPSLFTVMDWRQPAVMPQSFDFIWAGDIIYETRFVDPVLNFLNHALAPDGRVWFAEGGRNAFDDFKRALLANGWKYSRIAFNKVEALHEQKESVSASLWEISRG